MNFSALIVLYNCSLADSSSVTSLLQAELGDGLLTLYIWNNGPKLLDPQEVTLFLAKNNVNRVKVEVFQDIRNIALSQVYNHFLKKAGFDFFLVLDQDSVIPQDFFQVVKSHPELDIIMPLIVSKQKTIVYPLKNDTRKPISTQGLIDITTIDSISSGLLLSANLVHLFAVNNKLVFDERFVFYGIDTVFFYELAALNRQGNSIKAGCFNRLQHSLSIHEKEAVEVNKRRDMEYLYSEILIRLHFKKKSRLSVLLWLLLKKRKRMQGIKGFMLLLSCIRTKKHPRAGLSLNLSIK